MNTTHETLQEREEYLADLRKHLTALAEDMETLAAGIRDALNASEQETVRFVLDEHRTNGLNYITDSQGRITFNVLPIYRAAHCYADYYPDTF